MKRTISFTLLVALAVSGAQSKDQQGNSSRTRRDGDLVSVNVLVTDQAGHPVTDLKQADFHLYDDGVEQAIRTCSVEDAPTSIVIALDTSSSVTFSVPLSKKIVEKLIQGGNPNDEFALMQFQSRPALVVSFTSKATQLISAVDGLRAAGQTALLDALQMGGQLAVQGTRARKALVVISDGVDNHSRASYREMSRTAMEDGFPIYAIHLPLQPQAPARFSGGLIEQEILETAARLTGGRTFLVRDAQKVVAAAETIGSEIRSQYLIGYVPTNKMLDGKVHKIRVQVGGGKKLNLSHRTGYVSR